MTKKSSKAEPKVWGIKPVLPVGPRLMSKAEVCGVVGISYQTIWKMMCAGKFPRGLAVGGQTKWRSDDIDAYVAGLKPRKLKGDAPQNAVA